MNRRFLSAISAAITLIATNGLDANEEGRFRGMCDASAVAMLDSDLFVVGDDEDNFLRTYSLQRPGMPLDSVNVSRFLGFRKTTGETDIEGAAKIGDRIYWISSHGRNSAAKAQPRRQRFFAITARVVNGRPEIRPAGAPYSNLLRDLVNDPRLERFELASASRGAPKENGGLNIEGLVATPDGRLLIGFRNPVPDGKALIVPLENPAEIVSGKRARFGDPVQIDLGGLGIRAMTRWRDGYLIVAGDTASARESALYEWDGRRGTPSLIRAVSFSGFNPEAIAVLPDPNGSDLLVLSDDGTRMCDGEECKRLKDPARKRFRHRLLKLHSPGFPNGPGSLPDTPR